MNIFRYLTKWDYVSLVICVGLIVAQVWLDLKMPEYLNLIIQYATTSGSLSDIWANGGLMLACALGSAGLAILTGFFAARIAAGFSNRLRSAVFNKVEGFSMEEIHKFSTPSLITRSTNDITQIQMAIAIGMQVIIKAPILAIWAVCKIVGQNWQWSVTTAIAVGAMLLLFAIVIGVSYKKFQRLQKQTDDLNAITRENLNGIRVVRAYNAENYQQEKFDSANNNLTKTNTFIARVMSILMPFINIIMSGVTLAIYILAAYIFNDTTVMGRPLVIANMMEFCSYAMMVVMAFMMLVMIFIILPRAITAGKRINEVLNTQSTIHDGEVSINNNTLRGEIEFKNVSFKYPDAEEYVLENISFTASKGETVAFIGSTGSGKSTLINLVPRFYDVTGGEITIDGINIKDYTLEALHNKIGYVPQRAVMFSGTIGSNVAFGDKNGVQPDEKMIEKAIEVAQAKEFVESKSEKTNSPITQGGTNVSGGQKQRLAIARAIARDPEIYIFDDSFSALDYKTDRALRSELKQHTKDATILIVAQRIGTIKDADKIIVLDEGKMVGIGKHDELLKNCPVYQEIALSQLSKEELENE
ncbi:MAG: ABC transporter ATP-binding protein [Clostridia bacterium]|nr:ABC transporter ATP-binding protein [Clostridia bacterium]